MKKIYNGLLRLNCSGVIVKLAVAEGEEALVDRLTTAWGIEEEVVVVSLGMEVEVAGIGDQGACSRVVAKWTSRKPRLLSQLQSVA
jgi:hypothetical protein